VTTNTNDIMCPKCGNTLDTDELLTDAQRALDECRASEVKAIVERDEALAEVAALRNGMQSIADECGSPDATCSAICAAIRARPTIATVAALLQATLGKYAEVAFCLNWIVGRSDLSPQTRDLAATLHEAMQTEQHP
jgi:hypothetical protein